MKCLPRDGELAVPPTQKELTTGGRPVRRLCVRLDTGCRCPAVPNRLEVSERGPHRPAGAALESAPGRAVAARRFRRCGGGPAGGGGNSLSPR